MTQAYRVLAQKYRPQTLAQVIGQESLVKTLSEGIVKGRIPNAFLLHGIRGVGKTTTARILAKALNCIGSDGNGQMTTEPCGKCNSCIAIQEDRHMDVVEMDAASRTSVDDIREVIEASKYKAVDARYRIYIIDEVHMLSKSAFNALLKTLEEPPKHVKFIFATTEIRKIPDTILSRCMRFDLNRMTPESLLVLFKDVLQKESVAIEDDALAMIVRASDGSARDGLSLLDQAIALSSDSIDAQTVQAMLGLVDRGQVFEMLTALLQGKIEAAIAIMRSIYAAGGDAVQIMDALLDAVYWVICMKSTPRLAKDPTWPEKDREQAKLVADKISMPKLMQSWQTLLKGYQEVNIAPHPYQAAEMVVVRITYMSDLPSLEALIKSPPATMTLTSPATIETPIIANSKQYTFVELAKLIEDAKEMNLHYALSNDAHFVRIEPGCLYLRLKEQANRMFAVELGKKLTELTGKSWRIQQSQEQGEPTLAEQKAKAKLTELETIKDTQPVKSLLETFPDTKVKITN